MSQAPAQHSFFAAARRRFFADFQGRLGVVGILILLVPAVAAPLLANGRPLLVFGKEGLRLPFLPFLFAPDSTEFLVEQFFNYVLLLLPLWLLIALIVRRQFPRRILCGAAALLLLLPFAAARPKLDKTDYRLAAAESGERAVFAPIPYGPFEIIARPYQKPSREHWLGTDEVGRDVASRMIYGARASLAVGLFATAIALVIGTLVGLMAGYYRGWFDLAVMRLVEILLCFPTFLLLLILMSILKDRKFEQSILVVIAVIGLTGWIGLTFLVRGEVLKQRALPYIQSCEVVGISAWRTMTVHLLPNITGPILISFTFGVAGAILAESGLSFLGFGVQPPTASWGGLLRQAFDNPLEYWHLTLFPGIALFIAVLAFNFTGEGLRKALFPR
ncbi:ABC transporter permease [Victivallaceae bacterium BBE-744-WT-12]|uniref:ABC transporter permease n=1 Tax=Victivallis lenta TaxID=2606640 RepID=A0A844G3K0_9BACT|nr:ABC transporter permease [Victivallis lenta]